MVEYGEPGVCEGEKVVTVWKVVRRVEMENWKRRRGREGEESVGGGSWEAGESCRWEARRRVASDIGEPEREVMTSRDQRLDDAAVFGRVMLQRNRLYIYRIWYCREMYTLNYPSKVYSQLVNVEVGERV